MYTKTVKYVDFLGEERTEDVYFNYTKSEVVQMQMETEGGFTKKLEDISKAKDYVTLSKLIRTLILGAYGKISADGRRFEKSEELSKEFSQTGAYDELMTELLTDTKKAVEFIVAIFPKEAQDNIKGAPEYVSLMNSGD